MGWESRDWAKWTDEERARFYLDRPSPLSPERIGRLRPASPDGRWSRIGLAAAVSAAISVATWQLHVLPLQLPGSQQSRSVPQAGDVVHLADSPSLDVPAPIPQRWTTSDPRFGSLAVVVKVGETPRHAISTALTARGYRVTP